MNPEHMTRKSRRMKSKFVLLAVIAVPLVGAITMLLWNWLMPAIFGLRAISFLQALGILLLSKLLFGGFHGGRGRRCRASRWDRQMMERWESMTPEERQKALESMRTRWESGEQGTAPPRAFSDIL